MFFRKINWSLSVIMVILGLNTASGSCTEDYKQQLKDLKSFLSSLSLKDPKLQDPIERSRFVSMMADMKSVIRELLKQKDGPSTIAGTFFVPMIPAVKNGLNGDDELALLFLDAAEKLDPMDIKINNLYICASKCRRISEDKNAQSILLDQRLIAIHRIIRQNRPKY